MAQMKLLAPSALVSLLFFLLTITMIGGTAKTVQADQFGEMVQEAEEENEHAHRPFTHRELRLRRRAMDRLRDVQRAALGQHLGVDAAQVLRTPGETVADATKSQGKDGSGAGGPAGDAWDGSVAYRRSLDCGIRMAMLCMGEFARGVVLEHDKEHFVAEHNRLGFNETSLDDVLDLVGDLTRVADHSWITPLREHGSLAQGRGWLRNVLGWEAVTFLANELCDYENHTQDQRLLNASLYALRFAEHGALAPFQDDVIPTSGEGSRHAATTAKFVAELMTDTAAARVALDIADAIRYGDAPPNDTSRVTIDLMPDARMVSSVDDLVQYWSGYKNAADAVLANSVGRSALVVTEREGERRLLRAYVLLAYWFADIDPETHQRIMREFGSDETQRIFESPAVQAAFEKYFTLAICLLCAVVALPFVVCCCCCCCFWGCICRKLWRRGPQAVPRERGAHPHAD